jgi:hypothetical protein
MAQCVSGVLVVCPPHVASAQVYAFATTVLRCTAALAAAGGPPLAGQVLSHLYDAGALVHMLRVLATPSVTGGDAEIMGGVLDGVYGVLVQLACGEAQQVTMLTSMVSLVQQKAAVAGAD